MGMTFSGPQTDKLYTVYSEHVRLTPNVTSSDNSTIPPMHMPFMGMQGLYKDVPVFDKSSGLQVMNEDSKPITKGHDKDKGKRRYLRRLQTRHRRQDPCHRLGLSNRLRPPTGQELWRDQGWCDAVCAPQ